MVNKTQFYKTKVALAVVLSLGLAACGDSDGDANTASTVSDTLTEAVDNTTEQVAGTGSVQGTVLDTNGLPVMDATVSLAGQSVMTDASGYYHFAGVPLPGVDGVNGEASDADGVANAAATAYVVTITAPAGYASATVIVQAEDIQVDSNSNGIGTDSSTDTTAAGEALTWFDGFLAQATTATLPAFNASVTGVLRDCNTGAALPAGVKVALDFTSITSAIPGTGTIANNVTVGVPVFTATTGAEGVFTFDGLPADSTLSLLVEGYSVAGGTDSTETDNTLESVVTTGEGIVNNLGTTNLCLITSSDIIKPEVTDVTGWIDSSTGGYAVLNDGIDTVFTVHFNEALDAAAFDAEGVIVTDDDSTILATAAANGVVLADDGRSVTVTLAAAQDAGTKISIFIPWHNATDLAGNFFDVASNTAYTPSIDFDFKVDAASGKASFLRVNLCVFLPAIINPEGFTAAQSFDQDTALDANDAELAAYSNAFLDDKKADAELRQLNGQADTALALDLLAEEVSSAAANSFTADVDHAWVEIDLGEAATYDVDVGPLTAQTAEDLWFDGVEHGDEIEFTYNNDLGLASGTVVVTLVDGVKPTTTLQENYTLPGTTGYTAKLVTTGSVPTQGAGGEVTEVGVDATTGNPIIYVQPRHLTPTLANNTADTAVGAEFEALTDGVEARSATSTETPVFFTDSNGAGNTGVAQPIYDDAAFAAWTAADRANSMGVAFTENIALVASTTPIFSGTGVTLDNYSALNNVDKNIDGADHANGLSSEDLVRLDVSDMVALANDNHNTTLAFSGDVEDTAGNIADDNSQATVVFRDAMPPMVTNAVYTGTTLEITFNEELDTRANLSGQSIVVDDLDTTANATPVTLTLDSTVTSTAAAANTAFTISVDMKTLTVELGAESVNVNPLFEDGAADEFLWEEDGNNVELEQHASLNWDEISDANGNMWSSFDADTVAGRYEVEAPRFYAYNDVGAFTVTYAYAGLVAGAGPDTGGFTASITFSHPLDFGVNNPGAKTVYVEKADGDDNDVFFENVADIQRLLVLDINGNGVYNSGTEAFPAGTTAAWINTGGTTRLDLVVPTGLSIVYGQSTLVFGSVNNTVTDVTDISDTDAIVLGDVISSLTGQSRTVSDIINN